VVGLKPTYGRVSRYGLVAYASSLDQIGPITRDVRDAALLLNIIGGHDPADSTSLPDPMPDYEAALTAHTGRAWRIGVPKEYVDVEGLDDDVKNALSNTADTFRDMGAEIVEVSLPHTRYAIASYYIIATAEASANLARFDSVRYGFRDRDAERDGLLEMYRRSRAAGFGQEVKRRIILGTYVLSSGYYDAYYLRAQKVRTLIRNDFEKAFQACDVVLAPTAPTAAFRPGEFSSPLEMYLSDIYTISANLAGIPAVSIPSGLTGDGRPVGMQILGPAMGEAAILNAAYAYEQATDPIGKPEL
jgi:aspartyl-tRNA(Asn)/glutamyl-tRNA(Gln) amidotransferase subunit A